MAQTVDFKSAPLLEIGISQWRWRKSFAPLRSRLGALMAQRASALASTNFDFPGR
jgi:hypothetical protein